MVNWKIRYQENSKIIKANKRFKNSNVIKKYLRVYTLKLKKTFEVVNSFCEEEKIKYADE